jgi:hypothetical protein
MEISMKKTCVYRLFGSLKFCKANSIIECPVDNADIVGFGVCVSNCTDGINSLNV